MKNASDTALSDEPVWLSYLKLARIDHWTKNVFVLPGIIVPLSLENRRLEFADLSTILIGLFCVGLVTSSNYVLNELLDAASDRHHPEKKERPVPSGRVSVFWCYVEWIVLAVCGINLASLISHAFMVVLIALWVMGIVYNVPPIRSKDIPYLDVLTEAINNPLRMLAGWYLTGSALTPITSLLVFYWMIGCYFMAIKRFAEYRNIDDPLRAAAYRKSFATYNESRLLISIMFYASNAMLFFGAFIVRYRIELVLAFPFVAITMAIYLRLAFQDNSSAQAPERLYKEPHLMATLVASATVMYVLLSVDVPTIGRLFPPS